MRRLTIVTIAFALFGAACAAQGAVPVGPVDTGSPSSPRPTTEPEPTATPTQEPSPDPTSTQTFTYELWFSLPDPITGPKLFVTKRTEPFERGVGRIALTRLLDGPSRLESSVGVGTAIPAGTELLGLSIDRGIATVDLSGDFEAGGGAASTTMRLAQVVHTITQFESVEAVRFRLNGRAVTVVGDRGIALDRPVTREDYEDLLPAILVESPVAGERIESPVTVVGSSNTFEATVQIRIVDGSGRILADTFTTATCGSGCRGTYEERVRYTAPQDRLGEVIVFEASAEDGSMIHVVRIPVVLGR